jgi:hypothetical protein
MALAQGKVQAVQVEVTASVLLPDQSSSLAFTLVWELEITLTAT